MDWSTPSTLINSPLQASLLLEQAINNKRKAYAEWLNIRDTLTVEQNSHYMDVFMTMKGGIDKLRDSLKGQEGYIQAQLN